MLCFVTITSAKNLFPDFAPYAVFYIDILIFERKEQNKKKINRPHIEPVSWQNKLQSGPFSALSTCANEAVVGYYFMIVTSSFSKTKGSFCFRFTIDLQKMPLGKLRVVCIRNISKTKIKLVKKNMGCCFSVQLKTACKISGGFAEKRKTLKIIT